jgi:hypothetical protein
MSNIAVRNLELQDATTFKEIFDVYMDALEEPSNLYRYEKEVARDSLRNLAEFLDDERNPFSVEHWGALNRKKHE